MKTKAQKPWVVCFENKHVIGSICRPPCKQCNESEGKIGCYFHIDPVKRIPPPMMILGEATYKDYIDLMIETGSLNTPVPNSFGCFFYFVSMD